MAPSLYSWKGATLRIYFITHIIGFEIHVNKKYIHTFSYLQVFYLSFSSLADFAYKLSLVMDLKTSIILLLSFSLASTIKGEKIEEEGATFLKNLFNL